MSTATELALQEFVRSEGYQCELGAAGHILVGIPWHNANFARWTICLLMAIQGECLDLSVLPLASTSILPLPARLYLADPAVFVQLKALLAQCVQIGTQLIVKSKDS